LPPAPRQRFTAKDSTTATHVPLGNPKPRKGARTNGTLAPKLVGGLFEAVVHVPLGHPETMKSRSNFSRQRRGIVRAGREKTDGGRGRWGEAVRVLSPYLRISVSPYLRVWSLCSLPVRTMSHNLVNPLTGFSRKLCGERLPIPSRAGSHGVKE